MLTRRQIRVKVMQALYAYHNGNDQSLREGSQSIKESCHDMFSLYYTTLALFKSLWDYAHEQHKIQSTRLKTNRGVNPDDQRVVDIAPLQLIAKHPFLAKKIQDNKITLWEIEFEFVRSLYQSLIESLPFQDLKQIENPSFDHQKKWLVQSFKEIIAPNDRFYNYIEDLNMQWIDDLPVVNTYLLKQLRKLRANDLSSLNFPSVEEKKEDIAFGQSLYEKVVANNEFLDDEFKGKTPNWDPDRIALMDRMLIKIAIAELIYFPEIPPKVTLNEYLEIAKEYSTPKSNQFINGVLDKLVKEYIQNNRMHKKGRGLLE